MWSITYPSPVRITLSELKSAALGEFFDGINFGKLISDFLGIDFQMADSSEEAVGMSRLGSADFLGNLGPTFLLVAILFIVAIALCAALFYCARRLQFPPKIKSRIMDLKQKVFFNPMVRYVYLNFLKLNMGAMVGIFSANATYKEILP